MFNKIKIDVKDFVLKRVGIIINKNESITYIIPRELYLVIKLLYYILMMI